MSYWAHTSGQVIFKDEVAAGKLHSASAMVEWFSSTDPPCGQEGPIGEKWDGKPELSELDYPEDGDGKINFGKNLRGRGERHETEKVLDWLKGLDSNVVKCAYVTVSCQGPILWAERLEDGSLKVMWPSKEFESNFAP